MCFIYIYILYYYYYYYFIFILNVIIENQILYIYINKSLIFFKKNNIIKFINYNII